VSTDAANEEKTDAFRWNRQYVVTIALLGGFAVLVIAMIWLAGGTDDAWQRRVYVFGAVEAIVFTAIGWLFGREVNRTAAKTAREDAESARADAREKAARSAAAERQAISAQGKLDAVRAARRAGGPPAGRGAPADVAGQRSTPDQVDLAKFIDELLGPDH
jgi:hypothetical protein